MDAEEYNELKRGESFTPLVKWSNVTECQTTSKEGGLVTAPDFYVVVQQVGPSERMLLEYVLSFNSNVGCFERIVWLMTTFVFVPVALFLTGFLISQYCHFRVAYEELNSRKELRPVKWIDGYVNYCSVLTCSFPKPRESYWTWWKHEHYWTWPFHPYGDEVLSRHDRIIILGSTLAINMLITTVWKPAVYKAQQKFEGVMETSSAPGVLEHVIMTTPLVTVAKSVSGTVLYWMFYVQHWSDNNQGTSSRLFACARWLNLFVFLMLAGLYFYVSMGLLALMEMETCSALIFNTFASFFAVEFLDSVLVFPVRTLIQYHLLRAAGKSD